MNQSLDPALNSEKKHTCTICHALLGRRLIGDIEGPGRPYDVHFCDACKIGITLPVPSSQELVRLYSNGAYRGEEGKKFNPAGVLCFALKTDEKREG